MTGIGKSKEKGELRARSMHWSAIVKKSQEMRVMLVDKKRKGRAEIANEGVVGINEAKEEFKKKLKKVGRNMLKK